MLKTPEDIKTVEILISNKCQLNCKYCYIKSTGLNKFLTNENINKFDEFLCNKEKYVKRILDVFPNANRYEFWGAEPLLYYKDMHEMCKYIIDNTDKNDIKFMLSSNMAFEEDFIMQYIEDLIELKKYAEEKGIFVEYHLQCSIDFPASRHNALRKFENQKGSYSLVRKSYDNILSLGGMGYFNSDYFRFVFAVNTVTSINDFVPVDGMIQQISKILKEDVEKYREIINFNSSFKFNPLFFPSIVNLSNFTYLDGKKVYYFYKYLIDFIEKNSDNIHLDELIYYFSKDFIYWINSYLTEDVDQIYNGYACGVMFQNVQIDTGGNIIICHECLHLEKELKTPIILGNIFDEDVFSNKKLLNEIIEYKKDLLDSRPEFIEKIFNKYRNSFEKLNNREEYLNKVANRMFAFYMKQECLAENYMMHKSMTKFDLKNALTKIPPETLVLMEKFIIKHEEAIKLAMMNR